MARPSSSIGAVGEELLQGASAVTVCGTVVIPNGFSHEESVLACAVEKQIPRCARNDKLMVGEH
jgi:hypothetical protein